MRQKHTLTIKQLSASTEGKAILKGVDLTIRSGEVHALMGPNGSGKSTLAAVIMGHPNYQVTSGQILFDEQDITHMPTDKRAKLGLFLAFQYPVAVPGVSVGNFLRRAQEAQHHDSGSPTPLKLRGVKFFLEMMKKKMRQLKIEEAFISRSINDGFSGGEKKKLEVLQLSVLEPKIAILDETDSGLDVDALKTVAHGIQRMLRSTLASKTPGVLLITHYQQILNYITPDFVHVFLDGRIVTSGDAAIVKRIEQQGYNWVRS